MVFIGLAIGPWVRKIRQSLNFKKLIYCKAWWTLFPSQGISRWFLFRKHCPHYSGSSLCEPNLPRIPRPVDRCRPLSRPGWRYIQNLSRPRDSQTVPQIYLCVDTPYIHVHPQADTWVFKIQLQYDICWSQHVSLYCFNSRL